MTRPRSPSGPARRDFDWIPILSKVADDLPSEDLWRLASTSQAMHAEMQPLHEDRRLSEEARSVTGLA